MKFLKINLASYVLFTFLAGSSFVSAQEGSVTVNQDPKIDKLLQLKKDVNTSENSGSKYRIQIYSGNRNSAESTKSTFDSKFKDYNSTVSFETPNYKVWVGNFKTRLEADRALIKIKEEYGSAFIFKPKNKDK
ncbi:MAG TPA: SPOR domain-containing protein [Flavobacteriaceae bacterium]|nr:SPOR domain-containing protein [Flavobacteriaceae bacterium]